MHFDDIIKGHSKDVVEVMIYLRILMLSMDDLVEEGFYGGKVVKMASYSIGSTDNVIGVIGPGKNHCKLFLHHTDKIDAGGLKLEGKGKHARHIKIKSRHDMDDAVYADIIRQVTNIVISKV